MKARKVQTRVALLLALVCAVFVAGYTAMHYFEHKKLLSMHHSEELETRVLLDNLVELMGKAQSLFTYDYTYWDDMVRFVQFPDSEWAAINIDNAMVTYRVQGVWVLTPDFKILYHASRSGCFTPSCDIFRNFSAEELFRTEAFNHFYLYTDWGMMELFTAPIQPSEDTLRITEAQGYFITGRILEDEYISELARFLDADVVVSNEMPVPSGLKANKHYVMSVVKNLFSWDGQPVGSISAVRLSPLFKEIEGYTAREFLLYLLFALVIIGLIVYYLMKWVGLPLQKLSTSLRDDNPAPAAELQSNPTEFGLLAQQMVQSFHQKEELREKTKTLQALISASPEAIVAFNVDMNITLWNEAAERMFGWKAVETLGRRNPTVETEFRPEGYKRFCAVMNGESFTGFETKRCRKDGKSLDVSVAAAPLREEGGKVVGVLSMYADITDRKLAEAERARLEAKLQQIQKHQSLSLLAAGVAHDFNNLLQSILGNANLAMMDAPPDSELYISLRQIEKASLRAAGLTEQMIAYTGTSRLAKKPVDLNILISGMKTIVEAAVPENITLRFTATPEALFVELDMMQFQQVMLNLVTNAVEAIGEQSGEIVIRTGTLECGEDYFEKNGYIWNDVPEGRYCYFEVCDSGVGMNESTLANIFNPFFSTKFTGRGMGLAAVLGIVRGHKGAIIARSELGRGSTFTVYFPHLADKIETVKQDVIPVPILERREGLIIVAEMDHSIRLMVQKGLLKQGYQVLLASSLEHLLTLSQNYRENIDLIILDFSDASPQMSEIIYELYRISEDFKILLTGQLDPDKANQVVQDLNLTGYISKPYPMGALFKKLREILEVEV